MLAIAVAAICLLLFAGLAWIQLQREAGPIRSATIDAPQVPIEAPEIESALPARAAEDARAHPAPIKDADASDTIPLLVIDKDSGQPVRDAQVFVLDWPEDRVLFSQELGALEAQIEAQGRSLSTNERGEARLPRATHVASVFARQAGRWACEQYGASDERVVMSLVAERALEVHVRTFSGADAEGIDVVLRSVKWFGIQYHATSDARGLAHFKHLRPFMNIEDAQASEITIVAALATRPALMFPVLMEMPPRVELVLPESGALEVELLGTDGAAVDVPSAFTLKVLRGGVLKRVFTTMRQSSENGRVRFDPVEVGVELELSAQAQVSGELVEARETVQGPKVDAEVALVRLQLHGSLAAGYRAVDESGAPLVRHTLQGSVQDLVEDEGESRTRGMPEQLTDEDGRFRLQFPSVEESSEDGLRRRFELLTTRASDGMLLQCRIELGGREDAWQLERGDVRFLPAQLLVAGRVVDDQGDAVANAQVLIQVPLAAEDGERAPASEIYPAYVLSDAQGKFEARGRVDAPLLYVNAHDLERSVWSEPIQVSTGSSDLSLILPRNGRLGGSVLLPEGIGAYDLRVCWVLRTQGRSELRFATELESAPEPQLARFEFDSLPAGLGDLSVVASATQLMEFKNVLVVDGQHRRDPRLQRIDLRQLARVLRVTVETPDGRLVQSGDVHTTATVPVGMPRASYWPIERGVARCVVGAAPVEVKIRARGLRDEIRLGVDQEELRVRLRYPYEVQLEFRGMNLPAQLSSALTAPGRDPVDCVEYAPGPAGATMFAELCGAGSYLVRLRDNNPAEGAASALGEWTIVVADRDAPQSFILQVEPKAQERDKR